MIDLIKKLEVSVILVCRSTLGTINHSLLSIECLRARKIDIAGVILSGKRNEKNKAAIEKYGKVKILVIFDEVAVGFGRTGHMFVCNSVNCKPDLLCVSKGLTAGYLPLSATICSDEIYDCFLSSKIDKTFLHGHTFTANPLACSVANASLDLFKIEQTFKKIRKIEEHHREFTKSLITQSKVEKIRVLGSILAFNLKNSSNNYKEIESEKLRTLFSKGHLNIRPIGSCIYLLPPYCIDNEQLKRAYSGIIETLEKV